MRIKFYQPVGIFNAPLCDIGAAIGGTAQAVATGVAANKNLQGVEATNAANKDIAASTNAANYQIAQETNATNLASTLSTNATNLQIAQETNALQVAESEKAYQRSTASNQILELVKAGYSMQEAKMIVAGSGSAPSYTPATMQMAQMQAPHADPATMQMAQMQAPQVDAGAIGNAFGRFGGSIAQLGADFAAPDGGSTGAVVGSGAINFINENAAEIYDLSKGSVNTFLDFENWAIDSGNQKYIDFIGSSVWKKCKRYLPAVNAINTNMRNIFAANRTTTEQIKNTMQDTRCKIAQENLDTARKSLTESQEVLVVNQNQEQLMQNIIMQQRTAIEQRLATQIEATESARLQSQLVDYQREIKLADVITTTQMQQLLASGAQAALDYQLLTNPQYAENFIREATSTQEQKIAWNMVAACKDRETYNLLKSAPEFRYIIATYEQLHAANLDVENVGGEVHIGPLKIGASTNAGKGLLSAAAVTDAIAHGVGQALSLE